MLPIWQAFAVVLRLHGYSAWVGVLNSADYGVPQTRQRAILIASRVRTVQPPAPTHTKGGEQDDLFGEAAAAVGVDGPGPWLGRFLPPHARRGPDRAARRPGRHHRPASPAPCITGHARSDSWEYVNGTQENAARRPTTEPAPTVMFGHRSNDVRWVVSTGNNQATKGPGRPKDPEVDPAYWTSRIHDQSNSGDDGSWCAERPATAVVTRDIVPNPGANANRFNDSTKSRNDGIRVTVQEAAVLQSFPADYPWQGSRTKQFEQVGNAVPPRLALHVLCAVLGVPVPALAVAA